MSWLRKQKLMHPRAFTAGFLAFGIGATALPTSAWAGAGGHVGAPSMARSVVHPAVAPVPAVRPLVRKPVNEGFRAPLNRLGLHERGFPFWWSYGSAVPYSYPDYSEYPPSYEPPAGAYPPVENPPQGWPVVMHEPGCRTNRYNVPSEAGGQATVKIVRCY